MAFSGNQKTSLTIYGIYGKRQSFVARVAAVTLFWVPKQNLATTYVAKGDSSSTWVSKSASSGTWVKVNENDDSEAT